MGEDCQELVDFIVETNYEDLSAEAVTHTKQLALKTISGIIAGTQHPSGKKVLEYLSEKDTEKEESSLIGCGSKSSTWDAIFSSAMFSHASELEDDKLSSEEGPSWDITTFPVSLPLSEKYQIDGKSFITASAIGLEVLTRLSLPPTNGPMSDIPLQGASAGAAATAAKLMGMDRTGVKNALGIGLAGGFIYLPSTGTDAHYLDSTFQCLRGYKSALYANHGFDGDPVIGPLWTALYGDDAPNTEVISKDLGEKWFFRDITVKKYPCCFQTHRHIDALIEILDDQTIHHSDVEKIIVKLGPVENNTVNRPDPNTPDEAKFSIQHIMGATLIDNDVDNKHFTESALNDRELTGLRSRVQVECPDDVPEKFFVEPAKVEILLKSGGKLEKERENIIGSKEEPLPSAEHKNLFRKFTRGLLSEDVIEETADEILNLEECNNMKPLIETLTFETQ